MRGHSVRINEKPIHQFYVEMAIKWIVRPSTKKNNPINVLMTYLLVVYCTCMQYMVLFDCLRK